MYLNKSYDTFNNYPAVFATKQTLVTLSQKTRKNTISRAGYI